MIQNIIVVILTLIVFSASVFCFLLENGKILSVENTEEKKDKE